MQNAAMFAILVLLAPSAALADCQTEIATSYERANALPPSSGRAALLEQIQRADIARHEGDEGSCREELSIASDVLDQIDAARREQAGSGAKLGGKG